MSTTLYDSSYPLSDGQAFFITESAVFQEPKVVKEYKDKAIFKAVLQSYDEINQNKRRYRRSVLQEGMKELDDKVKSRACYNELDHPIKTGNTKFDIQRQTTVLLAEASHLLRAYDFVDGKLVGEMETLRTPKGYTMFGLLKDNTAVGFSMRGMGELIKMEGFYDVESPLTIICYDGVSNPSHKGSVVNFNEIRFENSVITESKNMICCNGYCFLPEYFDKLVDKKIITFVDKWV